MRSLPLAVVTEVSVLSPGDGQWNAAIFAGGDIMEIWTFTGLYNDDDTWLYKASQLFLVLSPCLQRHQKRCHWWPLCSLSSCSAVHCVHSVYRFVPASVLSLQAAAIASVWVQSSVQPQPRQGPHSAGQQGKPAPGHQQYSDLMWSYKIKKCEMNWRSPWFLNTPAKWGKTC